MFHPDTLDVLFSVRSQEMKGSLVESTYGFKVITVYFTIKVGPRTRYNKVCYHLYLDSLPVYPGNYR